MNMARWFVAMQMNTLLVTLPWKIYVIFQCRGKWGLCTEIDSMDIYLGVGKDPSRFACFNCSGGRLPRGETTMSACLPLTSPMVATIAGIRRTVLKKRRKNRTFQSGFWSGTCCQHLPAWHGSLNNVFSSVLLPVVGCFETHTRSRVRLISEDCMKQK